MSNDIARSTAPALRELPCKPLGAQPAFASEKLEDFVAERRIAVLAYVRADGRPHQTPIWYTYRDGMFYMTTVAGRPKQHALARNPRVSLTIQDERPPYRGLIVSGTVHLGPLDRQDDPSAGMAVRYFGRVAAGMYEDMTREVWDARGLTLIALTPEELMGFDNTAALSPFQLAFVRLRESLPIPRSWL